ncbi:MAG: transposase [Candidatus Hydrogenedentales bacterium]
MDAQKESEVVEGHLQPDHVHVCMSIPQKYAVASPNGPIKVTSPISIARNFVGRSRNYSGKNFLARGFFLSSGGLNEETLRRHIREQETEDARLKQLSRPYQQDPQDALLQGGHE